jgi:hypothetical protein
MSQLYNAVEKVDELLKHSGKTDKERIQARGQIAIKAGFMLASITPQTPDEPAKLAALRAAVRAVLGKEI